MFSDESSEFPPVLKYELRGEAVHECFAAFEAGGGIDRLRASSSTVAVRHDDELKVQAANSEVAVRDDVLLKLKAGHSKEALVRLQLWVDLWLVTAEEYEESVYTMLTVVQFRICDCGKR